MHNGIMAACSKERLSMRALGSYAQWSSRFMRYVDIKHNKYQRKQCIKKGPYILTLLVTLEVPAEGDNPGQALDACLTAREMWLAIERLQQRESINIQDMKTKLFWEFGKFTSRDGELVESYYTRIIKTNNINQISCYYEEQRQGDNKPLTPLSELAFEEESDKEQA
nr:hypothetical protein [Tanacetum cinerariifolium]